MSRNRCALLVIGPIWVVVTVLWVFFPAADYSPGDWRGDLSARAVFGLVAIGFFAILVAWEFRWFRRNRPSAEDR